uniref:Uncharacterized protein n=1 Tax=Fagus sylvatica TaxID=28930 RepID=A0A2N9IZC9_FAGSY
MDIFAFVLISYCSLVFLSGFSDAVDSITQFQFLIEGMTLVSKNESFVLGFFSPALLLGLPIQQNMSRIQYYRLLDSGNLVHLSAWKSPDDPSPGELTYGIEHHKYNELVMKKGSEMFFRTDPWDGYGHNGVPDIWYNFFSNKDKIDEGSGCVIWYGDLIDIRQNNANGQELYIRMSSSEIEPKKGGKTKIAVVVPTAALAVGFGMLLIGFYICRSSTNLKGKTTPL